MSVIDTRNNAHWAHSNRQFIWAARNFARKANTAVPLACGKQGTVSYDRRPPAIIAFLSVHVSSRLVGRLNPTSLANGTQNFRSRQSGYVYSKRIPKLLKTFPAIFTVPFNFGPELSEVLVEWKAPVVFQNTDSRFSQTKDCVPP